MTWLWQPLLPGGAQLQGSGAITYSITLSPASFAFTANNLSVSTKRVVELDPASFAFTPADLSVSTRRVITLSPVSFAYTPSALDVAATATGTARQPGPADDRPARRRRDRQISEAYWAQRQRESLEEQERERLEALAEAERALERAEDAKKVDAKRKAVRAVFAALRRAAVTEKARDDAQASEQAALAAIAGRQTEQQRAVYLAALDQLNVEIEAIGAEITRLYARRRQEEEFLLRMWAS